jgi:dimethylamine monooxygenase subunit B
MSGPKQIKVRVADVTPVATEIKRLTLVPIVGDELPEFSAGAHTVVTMHGKDRTIRNPYSLMSSPFERRHYQISVLRVPQSRGGSTFIHDQVKQGSELEITVPSNLFPIDRRARRHLFIAGGIGITPFVAMTDQLQREGGAFELHHGMRNRACGAYWADLQKQYPGRVHAYFDDEKSAVPLARLLDGQPLGTHLYVCGPAGMIDWVLKSAKEAGWPDENVHHERFAAPPPGLPFVIELKKSKKTINVGPFQSALEAIEEADVDAPFLCRGGACGQCETNVVSCDGAIAHNDHFLSDADHASGKKIMICVSRLNKAGGRLVLDL